MGAALGPPLPMVGEGPGVRVGGVARPHTCQTEVVMPRGGSLAVRSEGAALVLADLDADGRGDRRLAYRRRRRP